MMKITLYHNSECSKCRSVTKILEDSKLPFTAIEYLVTPPSEKTLDELLHQLGIEPAQLVRKGEDIYETLQLKIKPPKSREAWISVLVKNPILIERPIVTDGKTAVIGRPPEKVAEWLKINNY